MFLYEMVKEIRRVTLWKEMNKHYDMSISFLSEVIDYLQFYAEELSAGNIDPDTDLKEIKLKVHRGDIVAYATDENSNDDWGFSFVDWEKILSLKVDIPVNCSDLEFLAHVIWELSWNGLPEEMKERREYLKECLKED